MPNADVRRELPRRRNSGSPTSENSENANLVDLCYGEVHHSPGPENKETGPRLAKLGGACCMEVVSAPQILAPLPLSYRNTDGAAPPFTPHPRSQQRRKPMAPIGPGPPARHAQIAGYYVLVYTDTGDHTGRAVGRGLRAWGRSIT